MYNEAYKVKQAKFLNDCQFGVGNILKEKIYESTGNATLCNMPDCITSR